MQPGRSWVLCTASAYWVLGLAQAFSLSAATHLHPQSPMRGGLDRASHHLAWAQWGGEHGCRRCGPAQVLPLS